MHPYSQFQCFVWNDRYLEGLYRTEKFKWHGRYFSSMGVAVSDWKAAYHHIGVTNGFHFVYIVIFDNGIKHGVQRIQHLNNLANEKFMKQIIKSTFISVQNMPQGTLCPFNRKAFVH